MEPLVSIIIPTFNRNEIANTCLESILKCNLYNLEIIVINDYKHKEFSLDEINKSPYVKNINNPKNGVASARNLGASIATSSKLIFVDDDMILNKIAIEKAINFLNSTVNSTYNSNWEYEKILSNELKKIQFGRYLIKNNLTSLKGWNNNTIEWKSNSLIKTNGITSQFWAIKKLDFNTTGGYNENFPFAGFEDYDISSRLKKQGISNFIDSSSLIFHNELDRLNPISWLQRKKRGAITRKVAFEMGFTELQIKYSLLKSIALKYLTVTEPIFIKTLLLIPNYKVFDKIYFKIINLLIAVNIFNGYKNTNQVNL
jgi:glycosyltransferase involved in cell wall biosynthesis